MPIVPCERKNLIGINVNWNLSAEEAIRQGAPHSRSSKVWDLKILPQEEYQGVIRTDMSIVRFAERPTNQDVIEYATLAQQRVAFPQELLAVGKAVPFLASDLGRQAVRLISLAPCFDPDNVYEYEYYEEEDEENGLHMYLGVLWLRPQTQSDGNMRRAHGYRYDVWPTYYWFLLVDAPHHPVHIEQSTKTVPRPQQLPLFPPEP
jgi:hypothetical protein